MTLNFIGALEKSKIVLISINTAVPFPLLGQETGLQFSRRFIAALTETTFKQCGMLIKESMWYLNHNK